MNGADLARKTAITKMARMRRDALPDHPASRDAPPRKLALAGTRRESGPGKMDERGGRSLTLTNDRVPDDECRRPKARWQ